MRYDVLKKIQSICSVAFFSLQRVAFLFLIVSGFLFSCSDSDDTSVGFETSSITRTESDSVYSVKVNLGKVTSLTTVTIAIYGTAALDGDYKITTVQDNSSGIIAIGGSSSTSQQTVMVQAGESYGEVFFQIIDDPYVEPRAENVYFRISSISNASLEDKVTNQDYQFIIIDNDTPPSDAMRIDLSWQLGDGISVTNGDFDMYLATNVVVSNNQVVSKDLVDGVSSINTTGFETFNIGSAVPDGKYYIMIRYVSGTYDADTELVMSKGSSYSRATAHITATNVGKDFYFGPITKSGNSYSRVAEEEEFPRFIY